MRTVVTCALLLLLCLFGTEPAVAYEESYMPLSHGILSHRIRQRLLSESLQLGSAVWLGKTKVEISSNYSLIVRGSDNAFHPWSFVSDSMIGASVWAADLDKNGTDDLIILLHTGGCGWAPPTHLVVLMFEKNGRPFPWAVDGYFEVDNHGIKDLVDLDGNGHAELIRQGFDDGYWITSLYEARRARWHLVKNSGGMAFPLYTRFTDEDNHKAITPPSFRHPFESNLANDCGNPCESKKQKHLDEICWAGANHRDDPAFEFSDGLRLKAITWYGSMSIVLDEPSGRRMALLGSAEPARKLLSEIASRHLPVLTSGVRRHINGDTGIELIYAQAAFYGGSKCSSSRSYSRLATVIRNELKLLP